MALSQFGKGRTLLSRLKPFRVFERFRRTFVEDDSRAQSSLDLCQVDHSKWQKLDARQLGVERSMIPKSCQNVLWNLRHAGYDAYLVGGCVRDLILKRVPKDFDVITTAKLKQVRRKFPKAMIVGIRFPICRVLDGDSLVEVSSFSTAVEKSKRKGVSISEMPAGCDKRDFTLWNDCMQRDFTINSLFYDPFSNIIFDYVDAVKDLRSLKLKNLIPAHLAFKEDTAKILRGLRFAARLNLSFSQETEAALENLSSTVANISKQRLALEINNMLSYGAAEASLLLLRRFKLLEIFLPFQAAYLSVQADNQLDIRSLMLMKLFSNMDKLISCDRPCDGSLWLALMAFHLALFDNPQSALVVLTFASLLYRGTWEESIKFARQNAPAAQVYVPEILDAVDSLSDDEIAARVTQFAAQVSNSVKVFINLDYVLEAMATFPEVQSSGLVFVSRKMAQKVKDVFHILEKDVTSFNAARRFLDIDYRALTEGKIYEVRFVLGKIIIDTLVSMDTTEERVEKGDRRTNYPLQKLEVLKQIRAIQHTPTSHRRRDSMIKYGNKRKISQNSYEVLLGNSTETSLFGDSSIISEAGLGRKLGSESSELSDRTFNPDKTEKDENDKANKLQKTQPLLSHLFK